MTSIPFQQFSTIDEYIASQAPQVQTVLKKLRKVIIQAAPNSIETISYQMPAFKFHGMLLWFAAAKNHYAIYPKAEAIEAFIEKLNDYYVSKGTIRFSYDKPMPVALITEIVNFCVRKNIDKEIIRKAPK
jgi:uncharacterized protein YdhG (YjbR/CyaY superfamily)